MRALVIALLVTIAAPAAADPAPTPWSDGVPDAEQQSALAIFKDGNAHYANREYVEALASYREALTHWDHPAIHFNIAQCLIRLDQLVDALAEIELAKRFGDAPFSREQWDLLLDYEKTLGGRVGQLHVTCDQPDASITVDGTPWLTCPGEDTRVIEPGPHVVVGERAGFLTRADEVAVFPDGVADVEMTLIALDDVPTRLERRFDAWIPWAVMAGGGAVVVAGLGLHALAGADFDAHDAAFRQACPGPERCDPDAIPPAVASLARRAKLEQGFAFAAYGVGAAAVVAGVALLWIDQPRRVEIAPVITADGVGASLGGRW